MSDFSTCSLSSVISTYSFSTSAFTSAWFCTAIALRSLGGWPCPARPQGWFGSGVLGEGRGCMSGCCGCEYKAEPDTSAPAPAASANMSPRLEQIIGPPLSRKKKRSGVQLIASIWDDQHPFVVPRPRRENGAVCLNLRDDRERSCPFTHGHITSFLLIWPYVVIDE